MDNTYLVASRYERFIRMVFNCDVNKHGAHLSNMQNLMFMEDGKTYSKHLGSFEKQFAKVKNYIDKALCKLAKDAKNEEDKLFYNNLLSRLEYASHTEDLMNIISMVLDKLKGKA